MDIVEIRGYWIMGIVFFGIVVPAICAIGWLRMRDNTKDISALVALCFVCYLIFIFGYGQEVIIPKKYQVEYKKVYQCEYVEQMVPKYPDGVPEK